MSDPIDAAEAARKAAETPQRRYRRAARTAEQRAARTAEQRAAERAANTAARSAARAAAACEHAAADQPVGDLTNRQVARFHSKSNAQNITLNCTCLCGGVFDPEDAAEAARTATRTAQRHSFLLASTMLFGNGCSTWCKLLLVSESCLMYVHIQ